MIRRDFLALIASAPIAALAPWPHFLNAPRLAFHPKAFAMVMEPLMSIEEFTARYIQPAIEQWHSTCGYTPPCDPAHVDLLRLERVEAMLQLPPKDN